MDALMARTTQEPVQALPLTRIQPSPLQPRRDFPPESLEELADSIRAKGVLQPVLVRPRGEQYELIAGERRWRASQMAGLIEIPAIVRDADDHTVLEWMLIENLQREDLNPIEEALGYQQLILQFQLRQEDIAEQVGRNRATVANALRLLKLPAQVQAWIRHGQLSAGHAKAILGLDDPEDQNLAATQAIRDGLSVRATEELVACWQARQAREPARAGRDRTMPARDAQVADLEGRLRERLGTKVHLRYLRGKGAVTIQFYSDDDLSRVLKLLGIDLE